MQNFYQHLDIKPKKRTKLRVVLGKIYYRLKRYISWYLGNKKYSKRSDVVLPYILFEHQTPIYRQLRDVDMWMQENKAHNLRIAIEKLNSVVIQPGETFSYWKLIGKPTKFKGYKPGMILYYGQFKTGIGGGLCQLSNLIFWMTLHTSLTITERYRHSYDVFPDVARKIPFGCGATCVYNYRDLQIKNNTEYPYQLELFIEEGSLVGRWRCIEPENKHFEVYESNHIMHHHDWGGYSRHNCINRKVIQDNIEVADEYLFENHALMMYQPFIEEGKH